MVTLSIEDEEETVGFCSILLKISNNYSPLKLMVEAQQVCWAAAKLGNKNRRRNTSIVLRYAAPDGRLLNILIDAGKYELLSYVPNLHTNHTIFFIQNLSVCKTSLLWRNNEVSQESQWITICRMEWMVLISSTRITRIWGCTCNWN